MAHPRYSTDESAARGEALYRQRIKAELPPDAHGRLLAIDVNTGDYLLGDDYLELARQLRRRHPDAAVYVLRVGFPAVGRVGGRLALCA